MSASHIVDGGAFCATASYVPLSYMVSAEFDRLTVSEFSDVLANMEETERSDVLELTAQLERGQLVSEEPAPVPVAGNEIQVGGRRTVMELP